jgi:hypothetical protein
MFHVGQKVVCVDVAYAYRGRVVKRRDGHVAPFNGSLHGLCKGQVYTIAAIDPPSYPEFIQEQELVLAEIDRGCPITRGFRASRFRPLIERKTDISVFTEMLTPSTKRVKKRALVTQDNWDTP